MPRPYIRIALFALLLVPAVLRSCPYDNCGTSRYLAWLPGATPFSFDSTANFAGHSVRDTLRYPDGAIAGCGDVALNRDGRKTSYRTGPWTSYYPDGALRAFGSYGFATYSYCGLVPRQRYYSYRKGRWTFYYPNGRIQACGTFLVSASDPGGGIAGEVEYRAKIGPDFFLASADGSAPHDRRAFTSELDRTFTDPVNLLR